MMKVEINLLNEGSLKKRRSVGGIIILITLLLFPTIFFLFSIQHQQSVEAELTEVLRETKEMRLLAEQKLTNRKGERTHTSLNLEHALEYALDHQFEIHPLITSLFHPLPEDSELISIHYQQNQGIIFSVLFNESNEAAQYFSTIKKFSWVQEVELQSIQRLNDSDSSQNYSANYSVSINEQVFLEEGGK